MTVTDELIPVSKVKVGDSAEYPVTQLRSTSRMVGLDDSSVDSYEEISWDLECMAEITDPTSIRQLNETLRADLAKRGEAVTLTELGSASILPASGAGGSVIGYPHVEIIAIPGKSHAQYQYFTMRAITRIPIDQGNGVYQHSTNTEISTGIDGTITTSVSGSVMMVQGNDAVDWVTTNVLTPARNAASAAGDGIVTKTKIGNDPARCDYSYTVTPSTTGQQDVTVAAVEDRTAQDASGRWVRSISGYAEGANATAFANSQLISQSANLILIRKDGPSLPSLPSGRVSFSYQYVSGVTHPDFPGVFITRLEESVDLAGGGRELIANAYLQNNPALHLGRKLPFGVSESLTIEFLGSFSVVDPSVLLDPEFQIGGKRIRKGTRGVFKTYSRSISYIYDTEPDPLPNPRQLEGLT